MNICISRLTDMAEGINTPLTPLSYGIEVPEDFALSKVMLEQDGEKQKTDEHGELLYAKEVFRSEEEEAVLDHIEEVTEAREAIAFEDKEVTMYEIAGYEKKIDPDTGEPTEEDDPDKPIFTEVVEIMSVPTEFKELAPIMVPNMVPKVATLANTPNKFSFEEVLQAKYQQILDNSQRDYIIADRLLSEEDLDLMEPLHSANTGIGILVLNPMGQASTKPIDLLVPAQTFELLEFIADNGVDFYVDNVKAVNNLIILPSLVNRCTIKFVNTTDKPKTIQSYALAY